MWISILLLGVVTYAIYVLFESWRAERKYKELYRQFPGPTPYPLIGSNYVFFGHPEQILDVFDDLRKTYGSRYCLRGKRNNFCIHDPADVEKLLTSTTHINKGDLYVAVEDLTGDGLVLSKGQKWFHHRKLLTPGFHFSILNNFLITMNEHARTLVEILGKDFENNTSREILPYIGRYTLDTICSTAMGTNLNIQKDKDSFYLRAVEGVSNGVVTRSFQPWYRNYLLWICTARGREYYKFMKTLHSFVTDVIAFKKMQRDLEISISANKSMEQLHDDDVYASKSNKRLALLDTLLEAQKNPENKLSDEHVRDNTDTFMFAGHDTTKATIVWTLHYVSQNSEIQERIHKELDNIFGQDPTRDVNSADLTCMKYLEQCIKESLRIQPPAGIIQRSLETDLVLSDGAVIPGGSDIVIPISVIHRNEKVFPNSHVYDPDRFSPENSIGRHPFSYIPFSAGSRNCIGQKFAMMELKVALAHIFRSFNVQPVLRAEDVRPRMKLVILPNTKLPLTLNARKILSPLPDPHGS